MDVFRACCAQLLSTVKRWSSQSEPVPAASLQQLETTTAATCHVPSTVICRALLFDSSIIDSKIDILIDLLRISGREKEGDRDKKTEREKGTESANVTNASVVVKRI